MESVGLTCGSPHTPTATGAPEEVVLTEALQNFHTISAAHAAQIETHRKTLKLHDEDIAGKAGIHLEELVAKHEAHLVEVQKTMDKNAEVDLSDLRRTADAIAEAQQSMQTELLEKGCRSERSVDIGQCIKK